MMEVVRYDTFDSKEVNNFFLKQLTHLWILQLGSL